MYDRLKNRTLLILDTIISGANNAEQIEAIDVAMFDMYTPNNYMGSESVEIKYDKQFESACLIIAQKTSMDAKKMTVLQFYNALDTIKAQAEAEIKSFKNNKRR